MTLSIVSITDVTPRGGAPGTTLTIVGVGFGVATGLVIFDPTGTPASAVVTSWVDDQIVCTVPVLLNVQKNKHLTVQVVRQDETDHSTFPWWVPATPVSASGVDYQWPAFEAGSVLQDEDDPRVSQAADYNRQLDQVLQISSIEGRVGDVEDRLDDLEPRVDALETSDAAQDAAITALVAADVALDGRVDALEAQNVTDDSRLDAIETGQTTQDGRLTALEANPVLPAVANRLYAVLQENPAGTRTMALLPDDGIIGGYRNVADTTERDAIPADVRTIGMLARVTADDLIYILKNGVTNADWEELQTGGGAEIVDRFTGTLTNGQTVFNLSVEPADQYGVKMIVNGIVYDVDSGRFTVTGPTNQVVTWSSFALVAGADTVTIRYPEA
jgi:hypothetical protein